MPSLSRLSNALPRIFYGIVALATLALAAGSAHAELKTYIITTLNQSGTVGSTSFTDATIRVSYTGDTAAISGNTYSMSGTSINFSVFGGNLGSPLNGTFSSADSWQLGAYTASGSWIFTTRVSGNYLPAFGFRAPQADQNAQSSTTFANNQAMLLSSYSQTVTSLPSGGTSNNLTFTVTGGATPSANWFSAGSLGSGVSSSLGTFKINAPSSTTYYNGSIQTVPEPSTWAMALAGLACGGFMMRRQRTRACRNRAVRLVAVIVALCYLTLPRAADAGTLYVADRINNVVAAYNGTTGAVINSSFITGLNNPWFMTRDSDGNFYVTNRNSNSVGKYAPDGTVINASFISASDPMGVAVDNAGRLFLSVGSNVRTYNATTGALINSSFISGLNSPRPLALDGAGNLFVGEYFGSTVGKYDAATGAAVNASLITGFVTPLGLAFDATGTLFVSSLGNPGVQSFNASTGSAISAVRLGGFNGTFGLAFDESNNFFVSRYSDGFVAKLTATGSTVTNPLITLSALGPTSLVYVGAVPEPSTVAMALAAIACGGWSLWRRKRRTCPSGRCVAIAASLALVATLLSAGSTQAAPVTIDWVTVGNPGNAADGNGRGRVNDAYRIGKYEVTIGQYTEFLNAVAATDTYSLYDMGLIFNASVRGIQRNGVSGSYQYISLGSANKPVAFITWWDAARFANWMHNGQPTGPQGIGTTETGAYTLNGATSGAAPARNPGATVFLPTSDEWYKAAYYSPTKDGTGGYYTYAMQSDTAPGNVVGSGANQANYRSGGGTIYSVTQSSTFDSNQNYLTNAGAFTNSASYYGTFDQNGNVSEWSSPTAPASNIANWGGSWRWGIVDLMKGSPSSAAPDYRDEGFGFRLAAVPEPSTVAMALGAIVYGSLAMWRHRRRRDTR